MPSIITPTATPSNTAAPTLTPTSHPTSPPTQLDIISVNLFDAPIDDKVVRVKIRFYLGKFTTYFLVVFVVLLLLDYSQVGKRTTKRLHDSAFASNTYLPTQLTNNVGKHSKRHRNNHSKEVFSKLKKKDGAILALMEQQNRFDEIERGTSIESKRLSPFSRKILRSNRLVTKDTGYSDGFYAYIDQRRTYIGCEPLLYPDGVMHLCNHVLVRTEKGVLEDFVLFLCNNHSMLNCVFAVDGAPVDRLANKVIYICQNCIAFFMSAISGSIIQYCRAPSEANIVFDVIVTTPATIIIAKLIKALYSCPIGFSIDYHLQNPMMVRAIQLLGKLTLIPLMFAIAALLILATMFSQGHDYIQIIGYFFLQVQLYGFFLELIFTMLMFTSRFYMRCTIDLSLRSILLLEIGRRYSELIYHSGLVEGKDYHYRCYYVLLALRIECIYHFDDAIEKGFVTEADRLPADDDDDDVELAVHSVMHVVSNDTGSDVKIDKGKGEEEVDDSNVYVSYDTYSSNTNEVVPELAVESGSMTSNPLHTNRPKTDTKALSHMNNASASAADDVNDECTVSVDLSHMSDDMLADEEYALRKKQFKPETRTSFVEVYRKFEESEQISSNPNQTSVGRVDFLHNSLRRTTNSVLKPKK